MGGVFREIELKWKGEVYTMTPSLSILRSIKSHGLNNVQLASECFHGGVDPCDLVIVHRAFLGAAGVSITEEESYEFLTSGASEVVEFQLAYVQAVIPSVDLGKKPAAPAPKKKKSKPGRRKKT